MMRSPAQMTVIQLDITNACPRRCGACTRFCGHHPRPSAMDFETFKRAVDSLRDFPGIVGITGGEPTVHPEFDRLVRHYRSVIGFDEDVSGSYPPQSDFLGHLIADRMDILRHNHRGLFTSLGDKYYEHFELIQDTFGVQVVNDHGHPSRHSALLATRAELGIPDDEWRRLRDDCWVQKYWSASVTPKGAFFCEVAAALDALLGGPGGWPIEPGWWKRAPADFGGQLKWCELCGAALPLPPRDANDEVDEVSPAWKKRLEEIRSPKALAGLVREFDPAACAREDFEVADSPEPYLSDESLRMSKGQSSLVPRDVAVRASEPGRPAGPWLQEGARDWVLLLRGTPVTEDLEAMLKSHVFNPGCFYRLRNAPGRKPLDASFFSLRASSLRTPGPLDPEGRYPDSKRIDATVPASSGPRALAARLAQGLRRAGRRVRGWGRYLESLWSATLSRPGDAELLWRIILGKVRRCLPSCRPCRRLASSIAARLPEAPRPAGRALWVGAWMAFALLVQVYDFRHTANGLRLAGGLRAALAAVFALAALSMLAEYGGAFLRRPYPERLRSFNALWFSASAAAAVLHLAGYLVRCGLGNHGLRLPLTLAALALTAAFAAALVRGRPRPYCRNG